MVYTTRREMVGPRKQVKKQAKKQVGETYEICDAFRNNILSGSFEFENDGENRSLGKGDSVLLASGVKHRVLCTEKGKVLDVFNPERKDFL